MKIRRKEICDCGTLERCSREPGHPIRFDPELNEYHIAFGDEGQMMIYFCPFCGGEVPKSRRESMFAHVTSEEERRICFLFEGINTEEDVLRKFGRPDAEEDVGLMFRYPEKSGQPGYGGALRTLTYKNLSPVADIVFYVKEDGQVQGTWVEKYIGKKIG